MNHIDEVLRIIDKVMGEENDLDEEDDDLAQEVAFYHEHGQPHPTEEEDNEPLPGDGLPPSDYWPEDEDPTAGFLYEAFWDRTK